VPPIDTICNTNTRLIINKKKEKTRSLFVLLNQINAKRSSINKGDNMIGHPRLFVAGNG
jgi:hypothetical protein